MKEVTSVLKQTALFKNLDSRTLRRLAEQAIEQNFKRNAVLFVEGDPSRGLYLIAKGAVRGVRSDRDGREQVIFIERAPATIAEVPAFDEGAYFSTVIAEEAARVYFFDKSYLQALCLEYPAFALTALKVVGQRARNLAELVEELALCEVGERLIHFLLSEAENQCKEMTVSEIHLNINLTRSQIAARIGTVREVVSRKLIRLKAEGLICFENHHWIIKDKDRLRQFANAGKK